MVVAEKWPRAKAFALREIMKDRASLCSCGTNAHWECILELLTEAENPGKDGFYRDKWFEFGAKILDSWELLEHGTSIAYAWLTDDGKLLLEFLRDFGTQDHDINDGSGHPFWTMDLGWTLEENNTDSYAEWASIRLSATKPN